MTTIALDQCRETAECRLPVDGGYSPGSGISSLTRRQVQFASGPVARFTVARNSIGWTDDEVRRAVGLFPATS